MKNHPLRGKTKKQKAAIFLREWGGGGHLEKDAFWFYLVKRWFWRQTNFYHAKYGFGDKSQLLSRKKMVFLRQTRPKPSFCEGKVGFSTKNHFLRGKTQKTIFFNIPHHSLQKLICFLFFGLARVSVQSCAPCGVCFVEIQPLRVAKNGIGHERVLNGIYEGNRSG